MELFRLFDVSHQHDIVQLEIPVDNFHIVKVLDGRHQLLHQKLANVLGDPGHDLAGLELEAKEVVGQVDALDELHDDVDVLVVVEALVELGDVRVVHREHHGDFVLKQLLHVGRVGQPLVLTL